MQHLDLGNNLLIRRLYQRYYDIPTFIELVVTWQWFWELRDLVTKVLHWVKCLGKTFFLKYSSKVFLVIRTKWLNRQSKDRFFCCSLSWSAPQHTYRLTLADA